MTAREAAWRKFVADFKVDVPESAIEDELAYIKLDMRHRMRYDAMSGGPAHPFPERELAEQDAELRAAAAFEAKAPLVLRAIIEGRRLTATRDELEAEAAAIAEREGSTVDMVKRFFGEDLALLERDVVERKAVDWACGQVRS